MNSFNLILAGWNCYNGYYLEIISLELWKPVNIDSNLFGIHFSPNGFLILYILFFKITIFDKTVI